MKLGFPGRLAAVAALAAVVSIPGTPASAAVTCASAAHAYATQQIALVDPLKTLQGCIRVRLDKIEDKPATDAPKKADINWGRCRATAARYARDADTVPATELIELNGCVTQAIKDFK